MSSLFITNLGSGGGSGGSPSVTVIDGFDSQSPTAALSANSGHILNNEQIKLRTELEESIKKQDEHSKMIASETQLGHVMVDGKTIIIDEFGKISAVGSELTGRFYEQAVLETTEVDQSRWKIPFTDLNYPQDLVIVSQNSTFLPTNKYSIVQVGEEWFVDIPNTSVYPLPIKNNNVFVVMIKGFGGGIASIVQKSYEEKLPTTSIGQNKWEITASNFDPANDTVFPVYNTTIMTEGMYTITEESGKYYITVNNIPSDLPIRNNNLSLKVLYNTVSTGMNDISGQLLIDGSIPEKKLMQNVIDKLNLRIVTFEEQGVVTLGDANAHRPMPFECNIESFDLSVLKTSQQPLAVNIVTTTDFSSWTKLLANDITIPANSHVTSVKLDSPVKINKGQIVRLTVVSTQGDAQSLVINMNVKTI